MFEIARLGSAVAQCRGRSLAHLMAMHATDDNRASRWQFPMPVLKRVGITPVCADGHPIVGAKRRSVADINENRRGGGTNRAIQFDRGN